MNDFVALPNPARVCPNNWLVARIRTVEGPLAGREQPICPLQSGPPGLAALHRADALDEIDCTAVNGKGLVRRHQTQWFEECLSKQQPVKWITVM
jgi:hypothetical protein